MLIIYFTLAECQLLFCFFGRAQVPARSGSAVKSLRFTPLIASAQRLSMDSTRLKRLRIGMDSAQKKDPEKVFSFNLLSFNIIFPFVDIMHVLCMRSSGLVLATVLFEKSKAI